MAVVLQFMLSLESIQEVLNIAETDQSPKLNAVQEEILKDFQQVLVSEDSEYSPKNRI